MFHEPKNARRSLSGFLACLLMLGGGLDVTAYAAGAAHVAGRADSVVKQGASVVVGSRVFIDGVEVDPSVERYTSPTSGDVYRIQRNGDAVAVVLERSGQKNGVTRIESHASGRGATANAGKVVITTGQ